MKKLHVIILLLFFLTAGCNEKPIHLIILHYNDFHGAVFPRVGTDLKDSGALLGGSSYISGYINKVRSENEYVLFLNAGDELRGSPVSDITEGKALFDLLNIVKPDAFEIGNHEFDYGLKNLKKCIRMAEFPVLCSNILIKDDPELPLKPYIIKDFGALKVGIIGLITQSLKNIVMPTKLRDVEVINSLKAITPLVKKLRKEVDILIILSHEDIEVEKKIARKIPGIDIMITGHDHLRLNPPMKVNNTLIAQAGSNGKYIGRIDLYFDITARKIIHKEGTLIKTLYYNMPEDEAVKNEVLKLEELLGKELFEKIGTLEASWKLKDKNTESGAGNFEADVLREFANADIAFVNSGSVRKSMIPGPVTTSDIWELFPFDDEAYLYEMNGKMVKEILEHNCSGRSDILQVSGIKYCYDSQKPAGKRLVSVHIEGEILYPNRIYKVAVLDYVAHLSKRYFGFKIKEMDYINLSSFGKKEITDFIKIKKIIKTGIEGRIVNISRDQ